MHKPEKSYRLEEKDPDSSILRDPIEFELIPPITKSDTQSNNHQPQTEHDNSPELHRNILINNQTEPDPLISRAHQEDSSLHSGLITRVEDIPKSYKSPAEKANWLSYLFFLYMVPFLCKVRSKLLKSRPIQLEDLPEIGREEEISYYRDKLQESYIKRIQKGKKPSILWPYIHTFKYQLLKQLIINFINSGSRIMYAYFLLKTIEAMSTETKDYRVIFGWVGGMIGMLIIATLGIHHDYMNGGYLVARGKLALIGLIYQKISRLNLYSLHQLSIGKVVNIVANDINIFDTGFFFIFYLISAVPGLIGTTILLWEIFGPSCLTGIGCILLTYPLQKFISVRAIRFVKKKNVVTDERIKLTNEAIEGIRLLKMYAWEMNFCEFIQKCRKEERRNLSALAQYEFINNYTLAKSVPLLASLLIYLTYYYVERVPTSAQVFATVILMTTVRLQIIKYGTIGIKFIDEARVLFTRIRQILEMPEVEVKTEKIGLPPKDPQNAIEFDNFEASWDKNTLKRPILTDINLNIKKGTLCSLVGRVGTGKSTMLLSFLQEVPSIQGQLRFDGRVAYVEQEPTIFSGTVRSNILFGRKYDEAYYNLVTEFCCLEDDFKSWPARDLTEIGEKGVNMSGGQRARVALARAAYSHADIYLLDDPLSAVDAKVAKKLFEGIKVLFKGKTVLLATHQVHFAREAEQIIVLDNGTVRASGSFKEIIEQDPGIISAFEDQSTKQSENTKEDGEDIKKENNDVQNDQALKNVEGKQHDENKEQHSAQPLSTVSKANGDGQKGKLFSKESTLSGTVTLKTYQRYLRESGSLLYFIIFALSAAVVEFSNIWFSRVLAYWTSGQYSERLAFGIMGLMVGVCVIACFLRNYFFIKMCLNSADTAHKSMLERVIRSPVSFFDTNPVGRTLNRFSNDVGTMDRIIPQAADEFMNGFFNLFAILITVFSIEPIIIAPGAFLIIGIYIIVQFTRRAIIETRSIELVTRSPMYSHFSLTLNGLIIVRSYHQQGNFNRYFMGLVNNNTKAFTRLYEWGRFLGFYIDFVGTIFTAAGICLLVTVGSSDVSLTGLGVSFLLSISTFMQYSVRQGINAHMMMASASRIYNFSDLPSEDTLKKPNDKQLLQKHWPNKGEIAFKDVVMRYRPELDPVVHGLTFTARGSEKIGCIGRTGAGKSSILQILFRMSEIDKTNPQTGAACEVTLDGEDIRELGLHTLRNSISIIPQIPFIFSGTVRRNLDPLGQNTDSEIMKALEEVNLKDYVMSLEKGLDTDMSSSSSVFSVGQRQLVCLARAILKNTKVIVLDEATANVDFETDNLIQTTIMNKFKDCTVFTIAHRLSTVANYDKILVMAAGRAVEFDHPYKLLVKNIGDEMITNTESHFAHMVLQTGKIASQNILNIARSNYFGKQNTNVV